MFAADLDSITLQAVEDYLAIGTPDAPSEGVHLDFKRSANRDIAKVAVGFSNVGGGLIFVGVDEANGLATAIPGYQPPGRADAKTHISNLIRQNADPVINFEIGQVFTQAGDSVAVVRVHAGPNPPYMFVNGGENRVLVRVNDENIPADLRTLESLFSRRGARFPVDERGNAPGLAGFYIRDRRHNHAPKLQVSPEHVRVWVRPAYSLKLRVDRSLEEAFLGEVTRCGRVSPEIHRRGPWDTDLLWRNDDIDIERRWRIRSDGAVGFVAHAGDVSPLAHHDERRIHLPELVADIWVALAVAGRMYCEVGYYGPVETRFDFSLLELQVVDASPHKCFGVSRIRGVGRTAPTNTQSAGWVAETHSEALLDVPDIVADAVFHALRTCRGADIDFSSFESSVNEVRLGAHAHCFGP